MILLPLSLSRIMSTSCCHSSQGYVMQRYRMEGCRNRRTAIVVPRLNPYDVKSYRPVIHVEGHQKVIFRQLLVYFDSNNLIPKFQSGFRKHHSTESDTLRVISDIYSSIDNGKIALLALLDVSAAFDTVDHDILMDRLAQSFGLVGNVFDWLASFVTGRTYAVRFGGATPPPPRKVRSGIPRVQSSVCCCTYCTQLMSQHSWNSWVSKCTSTPTTPNLTISVLHRTLRRWRFASTLPSRQSAAGCRRIDCAST